MSNQRVVGIYADPNLTKLTKLRSFLETLDSKSIITLPVLSDLDVKIRNEILLKKPHNPIKVWTPLEAELEVLPYDTVELLQDHLFLSYVKYFKTGRLYIFPHVYHSSDELNYSSRIQSMIIKAHLLDLKYEVIV